MDQSIAPHKNMCVERKRDFVENEFHPIKVSWSAYKLIRQTSNKFFPVGEAGRSHYKLLMRPNKVEAAVQCFRISRAAFAGFSGHGNSIYNIYIELTDCRSICLSIGTFV